MNPSHLGAWGLDPSLTRDHPKHKAECSSPWALHGAPGQRRLTSCSQRSGQAPSPPPTPHAPPNGAMSLHPKAPQRQKRSFPQLLDPEDRGRHPSLIQRRFQGRSPTEGPSDTGKQRLDANDCSGHPWRRGHERPGSSGAHRHGPPQRPSTRLLSPPRTLGAPAPQGSGSHRRMAAHSLRSIWTRWRGPKARRGRGAAHAGRGNEGRVRKPRGSRRQGVSWPWTRGFAARRVSLLFCPISRAFLCERRALGGERSGQQRSPMSEVRVGRMRRIWPLEDSGQALPEHRSRGRGRGFFWTGARGAG